MWYVICQFNFWLRYLNERIGQIFFWFVWNNKTSITSLKFQRCGKIYLKRLWSPLISYLIWSRADIKNICIKGKMGHRFWVLGLESSVLKSHLPWGSYTHSVACELYATLSKWFVAHYDTIYSITDYVFLCSTYKVDSNKNYRLFSLYFNAGTIAKL